MMRQKVAKSVCFGGVEGLGFPITDGISLGGHK